MVAAPRKFEFELVSPEKLVFSEPVDMAVVPGADGDFGVLAGHAPLISTLRPGVLQIWQGDTVEQSLFVAGGFAEVNEERCTVLADEAIPVSSIDPAAVTAEIEEMEAELSDVTDVPSRRLIETRLSIARAKLWAARTPTTH
jgi:F-type H+-transporting ATPase subunit epsilon